MILWILYGAIYAQMNYLESVDPSLPFETIGYQHNVEFYNGSAYYGDVSFRYSYNITRKIVDHDWIAGLFTITHSNATIPPLYVAMGFGESMLKLEYIACHNNLQNSVTNDTHLIKIHEHWTKGHYTMPAFFRFVDGKPIPFIIENLRGYMRGNTQYCFFERPVSPKDGFHHDILLDDATSVLWALSDKGVGKHIARGKALMIYSKGYLLPTEPFDYTYKLYHGGGMYICWMILFPSIAYMARFRKTSVAFWMVKKAALSVSGVIGFFTLIYLAKSTDTAMDTNPHMVLGYMILAFVLLQVILGTMNFSVTKSELKKVIKLCHRILGYTTITSAVIQIALGLNIIYPLLPNQSLPPNGYVYLTETCITWGIYFFTIIFWLIVFIDSELRTNFSRSSDEKASSKNAIPQKAPMRSERIESTSPMEISRKISWKTLNNEIQQGAYYVVANGKYVYDISEWIKSHPGGQLILQRALGTDISCDYFYAAGFDAAQFTAKKDVPAEGNLEKIVVKSFDKELFRRPSTNVKLPEAKPPEFSETEWDYIVSARQTHVHSKQAIKKLSKLLVAEIISDSDKPIFCPDEYRRYTLIDRINRNNHAVLKFALLYPFEAREEQPPAFEPGQCVEIQLYLKRKRISRYYSPFSGNMTTFSIALKYVNDGVFSDYFKSARPGSFQVKVRGPFGSSLLNIPGSSTVGYPDQIFFFVGGSGITPALQLLTKLYLPINVPLFVNTAQNYPNLEVAVGDIVTISHNYYTGWAYAKNLKTGKEGLLPVGYLTPSTPTKVNLIIIGKDKNYIGKDVVGGCLNAYRELIVLELIDQNEIHSEKIQSIFGKHNDNFRIFVCGPDGMNAAVASAISKIGGDYIDNTVMLGSDSFNI